VSSSRKPRSQINALTIDVEDWYQAVTSINAHPQRWDQFEARVDRNTYRILSILDAYGTRATFFILGRVAEQYPELIRDIAAAGHEIAVHGYDHKRLHSITPAEFRSEIQRAGALLSDLVSEQILGHRAPYFSINASTNWALDILVELGFRYDSSFFPTRNILYGYPGSPRFPHPVGDGNLIEFPLSTARWAGVTWPIAGGFYLRLFPYFLIRRGIQSIHAEGHPAVIYFHPWEIDSEHRYDRVTPREWIVQYTGRGRFESRLRRLLSDFDFVPLRDLLPELAS
jgi:polysaccharide deacetylase family protein (PEP-CTERM system associated)